MLYTHSPPTSTFTLHHSLVPILYSARCILFWNWTPIPTLVPCTGRGGRFQTVRGGNNCRLSVHLCLVESAKLSTSTCWYVPFPFSWRKGAARAHRPLVWIAPSIIATFNSLSIFHFCHFFIILNHFLYNSVSIFRFKWAKCEYKRERVRPRNFPNHPCNHHDRRERHRRGHARQTVRQACIRFVHSLHSFSSFRHHTLGIDSILELYFFCMAIKHSRFFRHAAPQIERRGFCKLTSSVMVSYVAINLVRYEEKGKGRQIGPFVNLRVCYRSTFAYKVRWL